MPTILAIETSCDETSAAVCHNGKILSNIIASQAIHEKFGGVVPELASRAHLQHIVPVVDQALSKAATEPRQLNAIAFTQSPGLIGSLLVGAEFAKSLSLALNIPLIAVPHLDAHVAANLIETPSLEFPFLCLTVSGGHTQIIKCISPLHYTLLGQTIDDAAGEAFDKSAKLLGLPYPGGPLIDYYAQSGNAIFQFPEPQVPGLNFSFSGLKTSILYFLQNAGKSFHSTSSATDEEQQQFIRENLSDICASIQNRIVSILLKKLKMAVRQTGITTVCIAGGVSANKGLRGSFLEMAKQNNWKAFIPSFEYCTDNAAMIAMVAHYKYLANDFSALNITPSATS